MDFIEVSSDDLTATHWIPTDDINTELYYITIDKVYPLFWDDSEREYQFIDDSGYPSVAYLIHNGKFVKFK